MKCSICGEEETSTPCACCGRPVCIECEQSGGCSDCGAPLCTECGTLCGSDGLHCKENE